MVTVNINAKVDLSDIDTADLREELDRRGFDALGLDVEPQDLEAIYQQFQTGRRDEAAERCERLIADALGKV